MLGNNEVLRRIMSGPLCDLAVKLNGQDGEEWEAALSKFLRKEPVWANGHSATPMPPKDFAVYLEIEVGGKNKDQFLAELQSSGFFVSNWAKDIMSEDAWKPGEKETVKFARATMRDLGFTNNPKMREVLARIRELGHSLCEPQDGPAIRLALTDQSRGDYFWFAMEQITDSGGYPHVFCVPRSADDERWLTAHWAYPEEEWALDNEIAFRLRK